MNARKRIMIGLSMETAIVAWLIMQHVGGDPNGPRGLVDFLADELAAAIKTNTKKGKGSSHKTTTLYTAMTQAGLDTRSVVVRGGIELVDEMAAVNRIMEVLDKEPPFPSITKEMLVGGLEAWDMAVDIGGDAPASARTAMLRLAKDENEG